MSIADYYIENGIDPRTGQLYHSGYDSDESYDRMLEEEEKEREEIRRREREANPPPTAKEKIRKEALDEWARHYGWEYVPLSETQRLEARSMDIYRRGEDNEKIPIPADHRQVTYKKDEYRLHFGLVTVGFFPIVGQTASAMMDHFSEETYTLYRRKHARLADVEVMFQNPWHYYGGSYPKDERYPEKQFRKV
eukprot:scaffold118826_cov43-Attheya_sp.AAC.1